MILLGQVRPDCDWNDKKLDKRRLGCRERAQFVMGIKEQGNPEAYKGAGKELHACRGHAKDMMHTVLGPVVGAMRLINPKIVLYIHDIDMVASIRRREGIKEKKRLDRAEIERDMLSKGELVTKLCNNEACKNFGTKHFHD